MKLFGFYLGREQPKEEKTELSFAPAENLDGAMEISSNQVNFYTAGLSLDNAAPIDEVQLITKYRDLSLQPEIDKAIDDIVNESFSYDDDAYPVKINLDKITNKTISESTKEKIRDEFEYILGLMNFKENCYEIFRKWYVDGRLYYEIVIDKEKTKEGVLGLKYIDPRKIRKIKEVQKKKDNSNTYVQGIFTNQKYKYYYLYNPTGISVNTSTGLRISPDQIAYCHSGISDRANKTILSHLQKAIKPFNQYTMMKDSMVTYYHTRAPERRIFNVEVGNLPTSKAEQYMNALMSKFRRKQTYDPETGNIRDDRKYLSVGEDFWFPKRDGRGTDVNVLQGGANLQEINDVVNMYKNELFESLNVPASRYKEGANFSLGRASEISRDELKFSKFISRLRKRFSIIFDEILSVQLALKEIISIEEYEELKKEIYYDFIQDSFFAELKMSEIWSNRMSNFRDAQDSIGSYFSKKWAVTNFLHLSEDEWKDMKDQIKKEAAEEPPVDPDGNPVSDSPDIPDDVEGDDDIVAPEDNPKVNENYDKIISMLNEFDHKFNEIQEENKNLHDKINEISKNNSAKLNESMLIDLKDDIFSLKKSIQTKNEIEESLNKLNV